MADYIPMEFGIRQKLHQGAGSIQALSSIIEREGWRRVLLVAGPGQYARGAAEPVEAQIRAAGAELAVFTKVQPNPESADIDGEGLALVREFRPDVVVGFGGGSTLDTAKGLVIVSGTDHSVNDFTIDKLFPGSPVGHDTLPMVAIPTTAGTGSEVCKNAVITDTNGVKLVLAHDAILPKYAIMDPDFLASLPFAVAAATSMDALVQALETLTNRRANDFTRTQSLRALALIGANIRAFVANPADPDAAQGMSLGCMYAGFSLGLAGIGQDHVITHPMSEAPYHMAHGDACGMVLPAVIEYNGLNCKELYRQAYAALSGRDVDVSDFEVDDFVEWAIQLNCDLHIAGDRSFEDWGFNNGEALDRMLQHPIIQMAVAINGGSGVSEYPRRTGIEDYRDIIRRVNVYSKEQALRAAVRVEIL
jgi:alcohol dehydrogenase class IV